MKLKEVIETCLNHSPLYHEGDEDKVIASNLKEFLLKTEGYFEEAAVFIDDLDEFEYLDQDEQAQLIMDIEEYLVEWSPLFVNYGQLFDNGDGIGFRLIDLSELEYLVLNQEELDLIPVFWPGREFIITFVEDGFYAVHEKLSH